MMTRRVLLSTAAAGSAGILFTTHTAQAVAEPLKHELPKHGPLFLNTILLGGTTAQKLEAARAAGFDQIELWRQNVESVEGGAPAVLQVLNQIDLGLTDYQVLLDFDGAPGPKRDAKRAEAIAMLNTAVQVKATTLLCPASTDPACDRSRIHDDLVWLADQAAQRGLRIAYEGMAWSVVNYTLASAWQTVKQLDRANVGMVVDSYHMFVRGRTPADLDGIPPDRIFLVQFADVQMPVAPADYRETARHHRLLPGDGSLPLLSLAVALDEMKYLGPVGLEVFNDDLKAEPPVQVAKRAFASLTHLLAAAAQAERSHPA